jgi:hypothetical protein
MPTWLISESGLPFSSLKHLCEVHLWGTVNGTKDNALSLKCTPKPHRAERQLATACGHHCNDRIPQ